MKQSTRERVIRAIVAGLMNSDLTTRELREATDELARNPSFSFDLTMSLNEFLERLSNNVYSKRIPSRLGGRSSKSGPESMELNFLHNLIQRRRLSKKEIFEIMGSISPNFKFSGPYTASVREILEEFFHIATRDEFTRFMQKLQGTSETDDPYLRGIIRKGL